MSPVLSAGRVAATVSIGFSTDRPPSVVQSRFVHDDLTGVMLANTPLELDPWRAGGLRYKTVIVVAVVAAVITAATDSDTVQVRTSVVCCISVGV